LPKVGDIHYYKLDNLPENLSLENRGGSIAWNLTSLSAPTAFDYRFLSSSQSSFSSFFPKADLLAIDLWQNENFFQKNGNGLFLVGEVIRTQNEHGNPILKKYTDPQPVYAVRYEVGDEKSYQSRWEAEFNGEDLKMTGGNKNRLYKIEAIEDHEERVSESGLLFLPRDRFDVIRVDKRIFATYKMFEFTNNRWMEIQTSSIPNIPISLESEWSETVFLSENSHEWIASIYFDEHKKARKALFKSDETQVKWNSKGTNSDMFLYPNPSFGMVRLDFVNLNPGAYFFEIYNIIGKKLWSQKYYVQGYTTIREDLSFLSKGTYLYSLVDKSGKKLFTKRMAIITP
jgi:hypothetical protein